MLNRGHLTLLHSTMLYVTSS